MSSIGPGIFPNCATKFLINSFKLIHQLIDCIAVAIAYFCNLMFSSRFVLVLVGELSAK